MMKDKVFQPALALLIGLMIVVIGLDQWTKSLASSLLSYNSPVEVFALLDWTLLHNKGAAFSFLSNAGGWQRWFFTAISIFAIKVFGQTRSESPAEVYFETSITFVSIDTGGKPKAIQH